MASFLGEEEPLEEVFPPQHQHATLEIKIFRVERGKWQIRIFIIIFKSRFRQYFQYHGK